MYVTDNARKSLRDRLDRIGMNEAYRVIPVARVLDDYALVLDRKRERMRRSGIRTERCWS